MNITEYLNSKGFHAFEGNSQQVQPQVDDLIQLSSKPNIRVMEIGFNAGHSAEIFLKNNKDLVLTSFDLGSHSYVLTAKEYIDITYPSRHTLMLGDSRTSVPLFIHNNKDVKFDIIFIDGCHYYDYAKADMENCMKLAHKDTIVIMDDTIFTSGWEACWTQGPTQVWKEFLSTNKIMELNHNDYSYGRGMAWGKYIL